MTTISLERLLSLSLLVPMGNPDSPLCKWGLPLMLWGDPGIGKSGRIEQAAQAVDLESHTIYPAAHMPEDASGTAVSDMKGGANVLNLMPAIIELNKAGRGVLFLDEISCARPAVQGAFLNIVYERTWLPPGVRVLVAGNPPESAAGGWSLSPPMANRLAHIDVKTPTPMEWVSWLLQGPTSDVENIVQAEHRVRQEWHDKFAKWKGYAAGFHRAKSGMLYALPNVGDVNRGRAWPSPRTWEFAVRAAATCDIIEPKGSIQGRSELVKGCIGAGVAKEWETWIASADLPHPKDVLENGWTPTKDRLDIAFAVCSTAIAYALEQQNVDERERLTLLSWKFLDMIDDKYKLGDIALAPATSLMRAGYSHKRNAIFEAAAKRLTQKFGKTGLAQYVTARS